jgi:hypothetical protein
MIRITGPHYGLQLPGIYQRYPARYRKVQPEWDGRGFFVETSVDDGQGQAVQRLGAAGRLCAWRAVAAMLMRAPAKDVARFQL